MDGEELRGGDVIGDGDASCAEVMEKGTLSPLTGSYLLIVLAEPHSEEDREIILQRLNKGLLSWDVQSSHVDLNCELLNLTNSNPEGDEARNGEKLVQWASENLVVEVLIHSQVNTLQQCMKNLLASFTRHRHIIHAGYTFQGSGSWILQDGTFSLSDYLELWSESEVQRILGAYKGDISVTMHCASEDGWTTERLSKEPFAKLCQIQMNPGDKMSNVHNSGIGSFVEFISKMLTPSPLKEILEPSDIVGNIRFSRPTLYVFPGGQGDAALFGINGFNMLIDGGFARRACFWEFTRHLDRLDAVLLTRVNNNTVGGLSSVIQRKVMSQVYPQIGHFFGNLIDRKSSSASAAAALLSAEEKKEKEDPSSSSEKLLVSLTDHGHRMMENLRNINLKPHLCFRESTIEPINLYHKVGHGKLDLYVLNPAKDSREVKEFLSKWNSDCKSFVSARMSSRQHGETKDFQFPILNLVSICALLVWQPANPRDPITRILFPGSTPQHKIFEALGKLKHLEFLKYPVCSAKTLAASHKSKVKSEKVISEAKEQLLSKVEEQQHQQQLHHQKDTSVPRSISKTSSSSTVIHHRSSSKASKEDVSSSTNRKETSMARRAVSRSNAALNADSNKTKSESPIQKSSRQIKSTATSRIDTGLAGKAPTKASKSKSATMDGTAPGATKKSPTSPPPSSKKLETTVGRVKSKSSDSPPQTPPKSAKEANNRRVIEHKTKTSSTTATTTTAAAKTEKVPSRAAVEVKRKTISSTTKSSIPATTASKSSPSKKPTAKKAPVTAAPKSIRGVKKVAGATAVVATGAGAAAAAALASSSAEDLGAEKKIQAETNGSVSTDEIKTEQEDQVRKVEGGEAASAAAVEEPLAVAEDEQPSSLQPASLPFESGSELSSLDHISVQEDEGQTVSGDERASSVVSRDHMYESETIHGEAADETEHEEEEDEEEEEYLIVEKDESTTDNLDERLGSKTMGSLDEPSVPEVQADDGTEEKMVKDEEPEVSKEKEQEEGEGDISKDKEVEPVPQEEELHVEHDEEAKVQEETEEPVKVETQEVDEIKQSEPEVVTEEDAKTDEELKPEKDEIVSESAAELGQSSEEAAEVAEETVTEIKEETVASEVAKDDEKSEEVKESAEEKEPTEAVEETVVAIDAKEVAAAAAAEKEVAEVTADEIQVAEPEKVSVDAAEDKESAAPSDEKEPEVSPEVKETTEETEKETVEPAGDKEAAPSEGFTTSGAETEAIETTAETKEAEESAAEEKQEAELTDTVSKKGEEFAAEVAAEKDVTVSSTEIEEAAVDVTAEKQETTADESLSAVSLEAEIIAATQKEKDEGEAAKLDTETEETAPEPSKKDATEVSEEVQASSAKDEGEPVTTEEIAITSEAVVQEESSAEAISVNATTLSDVKSDAAEIPSKGDATILEATSDKVDASKAKEITAEENLTEAAQEPSKEESDAAAAEKHDAESAEAALSGTPTTSEEGQAVQETTAAQKTDDKNEPAVTIETTSNEAEIPAQVAEAAEPISTEISMEVAQEKSTVEEQIDASAKSAEKSEDEPDSEIVPSKHDEISNEPPAKESTEQKPSTQAAAVEETSEAIKEPEVIQEQITPSDFTSEDKAIPSESAQEPAKEAAAAVDKAATVDETHSEPSVPQKDEKADTKEPEKITSAIDEPPKEENVPVSHKTDNKEYVSALETELPAAPSASLEIEKVSSSTAVEKISSVIDSAAESKMSLADELLATSISSEKVSTEDKDGAEEPVEEVSILMKNVSAVESTSTGTSAAQGILESQVECCTIEEQQQQPSSSTKDGEDDEKISQGESSPQVLQHEQHEKEVEEEETVSEKFPGNNQMFPQQDKVDHETEPLIQSSGEKKQEEGEEKKEVEIPMGEPISHELHEQAAAEKVGQEKHEQVPVSSHINEAELSQLEQDQYSAAQTLEKLLSSTPSAAIEPLKEDQSGEQILKEITPAAQDHDDEQLKEKVEPAVAPGVVQAEIETGRKASLEEQTSSAITEETQKEQTVAHDDATEEGEKATLEEEVLTQKKLEELSHDDKGISTISSLSQAETSETAVEKLVTEHEQTTDQEKTEYLEEKTQTLVDTALKADLAEGPSNVSETAPAAPVKPQEVEPEPESEKLSASQLSAEDIHAVGKPQEKEPTAVPQEKEPSKESSAPEISTETLQAEQKEEIIIETQKVKENEQITSPPSAEVVEQAQEEVVQQESIEPQPLAVEDRKKSTVAEAEVSISDDVEAKVPEEETKFTAASSEKKESVMPEATEAAAATFEKQADAPAPESEAPLAPEVTSSAAVSRKASSVAEDVAQTERKVEAAEEVIEAKKIEKEESPAESIKEKEAETIPKKEKESRAPAEIQEVAAETVSTIAAAAEELARKKSLEAVSSAKDEKPESDTIEPNAMECEIKSEVITTSETTDIQTQKEDATTASATAEDVVSSDEKVIVPTIEKVSAENVEKLDSILPSGKDDVSASKEELSSAATTVESTAAASTEKADSAATTVEHTAAVSTEKAGASASSEEAVEPKPEADSSVVSETKAEAFAPPGSPKPDEPKETETSKLASLPDEAPEDLKVSATEPSTEAAGKETQEPAIVTAASEKSDISKEQETEQTKPVEDSTSQAISKPTEESKATSEAITVPEVSSAGQEAEKEVPVLDSSTEGSAKRSSLVEEPSEEMESAKDIPVATDKQKDTIITDEFSALPPSVEQRKSSVTSAPSEAIPSSEVESKSESIKPLEIAPEIEVPTMTATTAATDDLLLAETSPVVEPSKAASEPLDVVEREPAIESSKISSVESIPDKQTESHVEDIIDSVLITTETVTTESAAATSVQSEAAKESAADQKDVPEKSETTTTALEAEEITDKVEEKQESLRRDSASTVVSEVITSSTATTITATATTEASSKSSDLLISGLSSDITQIAQEKSAVKETELFSLEKATPQTGSDVTAGMDSLTSEQQKSSTDDMITEIREEIFTLAHTTEVQASEKPTSPSIHAVADQIAEKLESLQKAAELFDKIENIPSETTTSTGRSETTTKLVEDDEKTDEDGIRSEETVTKTTSKDYIETMSEITEQIVTPSLGQQLLESSTLDTTTKPPESSLVNEDILQSKQEGIIAKSGVDHADDDDELKKTSKEPSSILFGSAEKVECEIKSIGATVEIAPQEGSTTAGIPSTSIVTSVVAQTSVVTEEIGSSMVSALESARKSGQEMEVSESATGGAAKGMNAKASAIDNVPADTNLASKSLEMFQQQQPEESLAEKYEDESVEKERLPTLALVQESNELAGGEAAAEVTADALHIQIPAGGDGEKITSSESTQLKASGDDVGAAVVRETVVREAAEDDHDSKFIRPLPYEETPLSQVDKLLRESRELIDKERKEQGKGIVGIPSAIPSKLPRESREVIRTPDEVADLPVHEEVEPGTYETDELIDEPDTEEQSEEDQGVEAMGIVNLPPAPPSPVPPSLQSATKPSEEINVTQQLIDITTSPSKPETLNEFPSAAAAATTVTTTFVDAPTKIDAAVSPVLESLFSGQSSKTFPEAGPSTTEMSSEQAAQTASQISSEKEGKNVPQPQEGASEDEKKKETGSSQLPEDVIEVEPEIQTDTSVKPSIIASKEEDKVVGECKEVVRGSTEMFLSQKGLTDVLTKTVTTSVVITPSTPPVSLEAGDDNGNQFSYEQEKGEKESSEEKAEKGKDSMADAGSHIIHEEKKGEESVAAAPCTATATTAVSGEEEKSKVACLSTGERERTLSTNSDESSTSSATPLTAVSNKESTEAGANRPEETTTVKAVVAVEEEKLEQSSSSALDKSMDKVQAKPSGSKETAAVVETDGPKEKLFVLPGEEEGDDREDNSDRDDHDIYGGTNDEPGMGAVCSGLLTAATTLSAAVISQSPEEFATKSFPGSGSESPQQQQSLQQTPQQQLQEDQSICKDTLERLESAEKTLRESLTTTTTTVESRTVVGETGSGVVKESLSSTKEAAGDLNVIDQIGSFSFNETTTNSEGFTAVTTTTTATSSSIHGTDVQEHRRVMETSNECQVTAEKVLTSSESNIAESTVPVSCSETLATKLLSSTTGDSNVGTGEAAATAHLVELDTEQIDICIDSSRSGNAGVTTDEKEKQDEEKPVVLPPTSSLASSSASIDPAAASSALEISTTTHQTTFTKESSSSLQTVVDSITATEGTLKVGSSSSTSAPYPTDLGSGSGEDNAESHSTKDHSHHVTLIQSDSRKSSIEDTQEFERAEQVVSSVIEQVEGQVEEKIKVAEQLLEEVEETLQEKSTTFFSSSSTTTAANELEQIRTISSEIITSSSSGSSTTANVGQHDAELASEMFLIADKNVGDVPKTVSPAQPAQPLLLQQQQDEDEEESCSVVVEKAEGESLEKSILPPSTSTTAPVSMETTTSTSQSTFTSIESNLEEHKSLSPSPSAPVKNDDVDDDSSLATSSVLDSTLTASTFSLTSSAPLSMVASTTSKSDGDDITTSSGVSTEKVTLSSASIPTTCGDSNEASSTAVKASDFVESIQEDGKGKGPIKIEMKTSDKSALSAEMTTTQHEQDKSTAEILTSAAVSDSKEKEERVVVESTTSTTTGDSSHSSASESRSVTTTQLITTTKESTGTEKESHEKCSTSSSESSRISTEDSSVVEGQSESVKEQSSLQQFAEDCGLGKSTGAFSATSNITASDSSQVSQSIRETSSLSSYLPSSTGGATAAAGPASIELCSAFTTGLPSSSLTSKTTYVTTTTTRYFTAGEPGEDQGSSKGESKVGSGGDDEGRTSEIIEHSQEISFFGVPSSSGAAASASATTTASAPVDILTSTSGDTQFVEIAKEREILRTSPGGSYYGGYGLVFGSAAGEEAEENPTDEESVYGEDSQSHSLRESNQSIITSSTSSFSTAGKPLLPTSDSSSSTTANTSPHVVTASSSASTTTASSSSTSTTSTTAATTTFIDKHGSSFEEMMTMRSGMIGDKFTSFIHTTSAAAAAAAADLMDEGSYSSGDFSDSQLSTMAGGMGGRDLDDVDNLTFDSDVPRPSDVENGNLPSLTSASTPTVITSYTTVSSSRVTVPGSKKEEEKITSTSGGSTATPTTTAASSFTTEFSSSSSAVSAPSSSSRQKEAKDDEDIVKTWGKPLGLPPVQNEEAAASNNNAAPPAAPTAESDSVPTAAASVSGTATAAAAATAAKGTPKKDKSVDRKNPDTPGRAGHSSSGTSRGRSHHRSSRNQSPIYVDLAYVPHHGNANYCDSEFFRLIRARYYVFSGLEPSRQVFDGLLEGKQSWDDKNLEVTIIPTYDTDTLGYWVVDSEDALAEARIDLAPSASRCTINLQDHETSCAAYRLEF